MPEEVEFKTATAKLFLKVYDKMDDCYNKSLSWGYKTGFYELDELTKGLHKSELTVIAARHSMGKTSFVSNLAVNLAKENTPVLYISYDLDQESIATRLISTISEVESSKIKDIRNNVQQYEKVANAMLELSKLADSGMLQIEANCYLYYKDLFDLIRKFKEEQGNGVVIVDYFQLVKLYKQEDSRIIELSSLAAAFKHLAMEIEMPIVLVSQVNKKCEDRREKRPLLSDLAECDALAQHSDNLIFIYREDYYRQNWDEDYDEYAEIVNAKGTAEITIAKQKNGPRGKFELIYQGNIYKFKNKIQNNGAF